LNGRPAILGGRPRLRVGTVLSMPELYPKIILVSSIE